MINIKDYADEEIVKSLKSAGLSDEYICENIENGNIKVEKSCGKHIEKAEEDFEDEHKFSERKDKDGKVVADVEDEDEYHDGKEKKVTKKKEKEIEEPEKDDIHKSLACYDERIDSLEKSLNKVASILKSVMESAPSFKGANLSGATLEKSINIVDEEGKKEMNIMTQRYDVRNAISKAISEEKDEAICKSLIDGTRLYLADPSCTEISQDAAMYLYGKGIRLTK